MDITVAVPLEDRDPDDPRNWKEPFEKIDLTGTASKIRAENEWNILLHVDGRDIKRLRKLTAGLKVETVTEQIGEGQKFIDQEFWSPEEKI